MQQFLQTIYQFISAIAASHVTSNKNNHLSSSQLIKTSVLEPHCLPLLGCSHYFWFLQATLGFCWVLAMPRWHCHPVDFEQAPKVEVLLAIFTFHLSLSHTCHSLHGPLQSTRNYENKNCIWWDRYETEFNMINIVLETIAVKLWKCL